MLESIGVGMLILVGIMLVNWIYSDIKKHNQQRPRNYFGQVMGICKMCGNPNIEPQYEVKRVPGGTVRDSDGNTKPLEREQLKFACRCGYIWAEQTLEEVK